MYSNIVQFGSEIILVPIIYDLWVSLYHTEGFFAISALLLSNRSVYAGQRLR
ncbi:hypothetical protein EXN66_Car020511 [Channa argus]|uniref:Uncharacterized protein n=1 Tax=Channa argus TaxID=215402 RepID=A0A6G1QQ64_CHAAH|nr:hypothetical protein EXN66_Car020511 [Channa argus]